MGEHMPCAYIPAQWKNGCVYVLCVCVCVNMCIYNYVCTFTYLRISMDLYVLGTAKAKDLYKWNGTADIARRSKVASNTETCNCESSWLAQREDHAQTPCAQEAVRGKPATRPGKLQQNQKTKKKQFSRILCMGHEFRRSPGILLFCFFWFSWFLVFFVVVEFVVFLVSLFFLWFLWLFYFFLVSLVFFVFMVFVVYCRNVFGRLLWASAGFLQFL